jgi:hypothetical protein
MKVHNASNENASVTLKPAEIEEITTFGFNSLSIIQNLLDDIVELHDNGENCSMCGQEYDNTDAYNGVDEVCSNSECVLNKAQKILKEFPKTLHALRIVFN